MSDETYPEDHVPTEPSFGDMEGRSFANLSLAGRPPMRESLEEVCLMCNGVGHWSSLYEDAIYTVPPGHRLEYIEGKTLVVLDSCQKHLVF
jgi:hypothetical protein